MAKKSTSTAKSPPPSKAPAPAKPRVEFLTNRYGEDRVGANLEEINLIPTNVNVRMFGKLFGRPVDGDLYAQPLIVNDLTIDGRKHASVVFLATSRNSVYAYDADDPNESLPLWETNVGALFDPPRLPAPRDAIFQGYLNFNGEVGITSTPVIARDRKGKGGVIYVVSKTISRPSSRRAWKDSDFAYHIHALDILTGKPAASVAGGQPAEIKARAVSAKVRPAKDVEVKFDPRMNLNRPGLLLLDGVLYLAFGSQGDVDPYSGWILAYDAGTLEKLGVHSPAIEWGEGGIWQSGNGLAGETTTATDGSIHHYVYTVVANGQRPVIQEDQPPPKPRLIFVNPMLKPDPDGVFYEPTIAEPVYGNSILKLELLPGDAPSVAGRPPTQGEPGTPRRFDVVDWFTTSDCIDLNQNDNDLISGPVLFDVAHQDGTTLSMVLGGGKDGRFYLCDRNKLGKWTPMSGTQKGQVVFKKEPDPAGKMVDVPSWQPRPADSTPQNAIYQDDKLCEFHIHGTPVIWRKAEGDLRAFVWSENDYLKSYAFDPGKIGEKKFGGPPKAPGGVRVTQSTSQYRLPPNELRMPGGFLAVSANGDTPTTGIVWAAHSTDDDAMNKTVKGTLRAFDAENLNNQLWTSDDEPEGRDRLGMLAKFCPPVVANGKVYMATFSRELVVYGLLPPEMAKNRQKDSGIFETRVFGNPVQGNCDFTCGRYNLTASGPGLISGSKQDGFYFAFLPLDADRDGVAIEITAQVLGLMAPPEMQHACAGLMIRLEGGKQKANDVLMPFAAVLATPKDGAFFLCRSELAQEDIDRVPPGKESHQDIQSSTMIPYWMKLTAVSTPGGGGFLEFTGSVSQDGKAWKDINSRTVIRMQGMVRVGLVATGTARSTANQSTEHVSVSFGGVTVFPHSS